MPTLTLYFTNTTRARRVRRSRSELFCRPAGRAPRVVRMCSRPEARGHDRDTARGVDGDPRSATLRLLPLRYIGVRYAVSQRDHT